MHRFIVHHFAKRVAFGAGPSQPSELAPTIFQFRLENLIEKVFSQRLDKTLKDD